MKNLIDAKVVSPTWMTPPYDECFFAYKSCHRVKNIGMAFICRL